MSPTMPTRHPTREPVGVSMGQHRVPPLPVPCSGPIVFVSVSYLTNSGSQVPWTYPPSHHHPPLIHDTHDIKVLKNLKTSYVCKVAANFVLAIRLVFWYKSGMATIKLQSTAVPLVFLVTVPYTHNA